MFASEFLWITAVPAFASLLASGIFLRATDASFVRRIIVALDLSRDILDHHVSQHFVPLEQDIREQDLVEQQKALLSCSDDLSSTYSKAVFEFRIARFSSEPASSFPVRWDVFISINCS